MDANIAKATKLNSHEDATSPHSIKKWFQWKKNGSTVTISLSVLWSFCLSIYPSLCVSEINCCPIWTSVFLVWYWKSWLKETNADGTDGIDV